MTDHEVKEAQGALDRRGQPGGVIIASNETNSRHYVIDERHGYPIVWGSYETHTAARMAARSAAALHVLPRVTEEGGE